MGVVTKRRQTGQSPTTSLQGPRLSALFIFSLLLLPRLLAAQYSLIGDCDEGNGSRWRPTKGTVYNYWEPTHYLVHGFGFQTWEYSPVYAIRSWSYIALHGSLIKVFDIFGLSKVYSRSHDGPEVVLRLSSFMAFEQHLQFSLLSVRLP